jgi:ABC-2 type transport system permease protein
MGFLMALVLPTLLYVVLLAVYGRPDYGPIFAGYVGIVLVGALFTAVGLFCSALTRSQVVAAVSAAAILFAVTVIPWWVRGKVILDQWISKAVDQFVQTRYADFSKGVIDTGNVVFFIACTVLLLFLTVKVVESRRWR